jgi:hypothetical protein
VIVFALTEKGPRGEVAPEVLAGLVVEWLGITVLFAGLGWWARYQPLPPVLIGLGVYVLLWLVATALDPSTAGQGIILKIAVVVGLVRAAQAAAKAR